MNVGGFPFATLDFNVSNIIDGVTPCRISPNGATEPNQETMVLDPNIDMDLIRVTPDGIIRVEDNFIYGAINPSTGFFDSFTNLRNNDFQTPSVTASLVEIEYYRDALTSCPTWVTYFGTRSGEEVPNLEDDLNRVWELENGASLTGGEIRYAILGY